MMRVPQVIRAIALTMAVVMAVLSVPLGVAQAGLVSTQQVLAERTVAEARTRVEAFVGRDDVRAQMVALGVDPIEAAARVASLSDAEIQLIAGQLEELPAGQGAVGAVVGAILIIFLVLLVTDLLGLTNVFPFVRR
jgi:hypothetical protein